MIPVEFRPAAAADIEEAAAWYDRQRPGLGNEFLAAVSRTISLITDNPWQFAVLYRETRRVLLQRFPYGIYFRVLDRILVVACIHARRNPRRWRGRG